LHAQRNIKGDTRLAIWLRNQGMSCDTFWEVYGGVSRKCLFWLADPTRYSLPMKQIPLAVLVRISEITGISAGELVDDVVAWSIWE